MEPGNRVLTYCDAFQHFSLWRSQLLANQNLLFYGVGSKLSLLQVKEISVSYRHAYLVESCFHLFCFPTDSLVYCRMMAYIRDLQRSALMTAS